MAVVILFLKEREKNEALHSKEQFDILENTLIRFLHGEPS